MEVQTAIEALGTAGTLISMFLLGRPGAAQRWGLWLNSGAGLVWIVAGVGLQSYPLIFQSAVIVAMNLFNLFSAHRRA